MFGGSNNPVVDIGISMTLQDRFSGPAGNVVSSWSNMMRDIQNYSSGISRGFESSMNTQLGAIRTMYKAFELSANLQKSVIVTNKMIGDGINHQKELMELAEDINLKNPLDLSDITSGERFMAMAGMGFDQIKGALKPAADLAYIFDQSLGGKGGTADLMTNIMATFGKTADEAQKVADIIGVGTTSANMGLNDLAQTIKYMGANARQVGIELEEVVTIAGVLGNRGIQGSMAGTNTGQGLVQMIRGIAGGHAGASKALKQLGLSREDLTDSEGNLLKIDAILKKIAERIQGLNNIDKTDIYRNLFGTRGTRAFDVLLGDALSSNSQYAQILNKIHNSAGWTTSTMKEVMDGMEGSIKNLSAAWVNFQNNFGKNLGPYIVPILKSISWIIVQATEFMKSPWGSFISGFVLISTVTGLIINGFRMLSLHVKFLTGGLATSASASGGLTRGLGAARLQARGITAELRAQYMLMAQMAILQNGGGRISPFVGSKVRIGMYKGAPAFFRAGKKGQGWTPVDPAVAERYMRMYFGGGGMGLTGGVTRGGAATAINRGASSGLTRVLTSVLGRSIGTGTARVATAIGRGILGITGGPWGLGISAALTFLPMIWDWLVGSSDDKQTQEDIAAREAAQRAEMIKAIREGSASKIAIDINGNAAGTFGDGDSLNVDFGGDYVDYSLGD